MASNNGHGCVLLVLLHRSDVDEVVSLGVRLARERGARLSLVSTAPRLPALAHLAYAAPAVVPPVLAPDGDDTAMKLCLDGLARIPPEIPVEHRTLYGDPCRVLPSVIQDEAFGAMVIHHRWADRGPLRRHLGGGWGNRVQVLLAGRARSDAL